MPEPGGKPCWKLPGRKCPARRGSFRKRLCPGNDAPGGGGTSGEARRRLLCGPGKMRRRVWRCLFLALCGLLPGRAGAPSPEEPPERSRPYAVLRGQNLVLMGTVLGILLVAGILMAFCVYKPLRRR
ncbi:uncharacterized protein C12orf76 homolog [Sorex araneus]|uniref:uncharacterized protein C12orf76 homolog n=1 Tax=Sorex araneus TaxID=42254 RepID=UPI002433FB93|nr:uncharacterized protein C12orf76 homolog [Sorex araneus]